MRIISKLFNDLRHGVMAAALAAALAGLAVVMPLAAAAVSADRVDAKRDWSIFEATIDGQKVCWVVTQPTASAAFNNGESVEVRRGDIFLMVAVYPNDQIDSEVMFMAGYPIQAGSKVETKVGDATFTMYPDGENAWLQSKEEDARVVSAFRGGAEAEVRGVSTRGNTTVDTFSLFGFTAALSAARTRCSGA
ncbi:MAG: invasion associated locus B family protein [Pseudomonadota bacterium]